MNDLRRILVPTDFSPGAQPAVDRGIDLAKQFNAELHLLHVALLADSSPMYPLFQTASNVEALYNQVHEYSERKLERLKSKLDLPSRVHAEVKHAGSAAPTILRYASDHAIDLIAIGTHGWRGMRRLLLGSVAEEVVREAPCPVMTFREHPEQPPRRPERILAAVDFSEMSRDVVRTARKLGNLYHARVDFVHVVPDLAEPHYYEAGHADEIVNRLPEIEAVVLDEIESLVRDVGGADCDVGYEVIHGRAFEQLAERAEKGRTDILVIAAQSVHQRIPIRLGSTAERVVRTAPCPVYVVRRNAGRSKEVALREEPQSSQGS